MSLGRPIFGHRDGFTADSFLALQDLTTSNPLFTGAVLALLIRRANGPLGANLIGWLLKRQNRTWPISIGTYFFITSILRKVSDYLSYKARNHGLKDVYTWSREIVVVTGASSGIGARVSQILSSKGIKVVGLDVQQPLYTVPGNMKFYICDITKKETMQKIGKQIREEVGNPTVLLNNAGIGRGSPILDMDARDYNAVMQVNALCHYNTVQEFLPYMIRNNHGHILTVASMASYTSQPGISAYSMSKAAVMAFHESLVMELFHHHQAKKVKCSLINPLWTKTPLLDVGIDAAGGKPGPKTMHVDTVAEAIVDTITSGEARHVMIPRAVTIASALRGMPDWLNYRIRHDAAKQMDSFEMPKN